MRGEGVLTDLSMRAIQKATRSYDPFGDKAGLAADELSRNRKVESVAVIRVTEQVDEIWRRGQKNV